MEKLYFRLHFRHDPFSAPKEISVFEASFPKIFSDHDTVIT